MKLYYCIFSKYDDPEFVLKTLQFDPLNMKNSIFKKVEAKNIRKAFEKCVKNHDVGIFWDTHITIYPYYINNKGRLAYYHKQFNLY